MEIAGKHAVVVGLGNSGIAAAGVLLDAGARVTGNDLRGEAALGSGVKDLAARGLELVLGQHPVALFSGADLVVVSPGVPQLPALAEAERSGVPVVSEVELASWFVQGTLIGITGTNGKSTVTTLVGMMVERTGRPCFVGGNLGTPLISVVGTAACGNDGIVVAELSSFQLERVPKLRVNIAAVLNLSDDHLDRYEDFDAYVAAKGNLFRGQLPQDQAVVPAGDIRCRGLAAAGRANIHGFGAGELAEVSVVDNHIVDATSGFSMPVAELKISGAHNLDNVCAATLIGRLAAVPTKDIGAALRSFSGLPHRMQWVAEVDGVRFYDDSKATNVGAAVASLSGLSGGVVLIAGGVDKGGSYQPLVAALQQRARGCVLIGEAAGTIASALAGAAFPVYREASMVQALDRARRLAVPGDTVLLAPACASFDMFGSYAERGRAFQQAVHSIVDGGQP